jgi:hypothetical protein
MEANGSNSPGQTRLFWLGLALIVLAYLLFILPGLDASIFWSDEAHTAIRAINVIERGLPYVTYGTNNAIVGPHDYNFAMLEASHGWLPHYICAASFAILGRSETAGRLPFVLAGALCIFCLAIIGRILFSAWAGLFAAAVMGLHPVFLKHCCQCRYYSLAILFSLTTVYFYLRWKESGNRKFSIALSISLFLLFMSFQLYAPIIAGSLFIYDLVTNRDDRWQAKLRKWIAPLLGAAALILPFAIFFAIGRQVLGASIDFAYFKNIPSQFFGGLSITSFFFPLLFLLGLVPVQRNKKSYLPCALSLLALFLLALVPAKYFIGYQQINDRYMLFMLPLGALVCARALMLLRNLKVLSVFAVILLFFGIVGSDSIINLPRTGAKDFGYWKKSFVELGSFYRNGLDPDPAKLTLEKIRHHSKEANSVHVKQFDPVLLMYYLGGDKLYLHCCGQLDETNGRYLVAGSTTEFSLEIDPSFVDCLQTTYDGIDLFSLNHAEGYRFQYVDDELKQLSFTFWECGVNPETSTMGKE